MNPKQFLAALSSLSQSPDGQVVLAPAAPKKSFYRFVGTLKPHQKSKIRPIRLLERKA